MALTKAKVLKIALFVGLIILAFASFTAVRVWQLSQEEHVAQEQIQKEKQKPQDELEGLTDRQKELYLAYTDKEQEVLALLKENAWADGRENAALHVENTKLIEERGKQEHITHFVIFGIDKKQEQKTQDGVDQNTEVFVLSCMDNENKSFFMKLEKIATVEGVGINLYSEDFKFSHDYNRVANNSHIEIASMTEDAQKLFGDKKVEEINARIKDISSLKYPTATKAEWTGIITQDFIHELVQTEFTLNNQAKAHIMISYDKAQDSLTVETQH